MNTFVFPIIRRDYILHALQSLHRTTPKNYKTVVVDQTEYNPLFSRILWDHCDIVIKPHKNYGFAQAANIGARLATGDFVTIANDDIEFFHDGWWDGVLEAFNRFPNALAVNPQSPKEPGWGVGKPGYIIHASLDECRADPQGVYTRLSEERGAAVVDGFAMWLTTFKRQEWADLGMFDERFFPGGGEDYDSLARLSQAGYRAISTPKSWVWHHWGQSKDKSDGFNCALPNAGDPWNKLSTKGFGKEGLWHPDIDIWGHGCVRIDKEVRRAEL